MYVFHWAIHKLSFIYKYHDLHQQYNKQTTIALFIIHPIEVMGFGVLWLFLWEQFIFLFMPEYCI